MQERLELLFETFLQVRTVAKVMRVFNGRNLDLPRRDRYGDLRWTRATTAAVATILKNPAYAGAFVYGRTRLRKPVNEGCSPMKTPMPMEDLRIVVKDRHPSYVDWRTYEKIREIIRDNRADYMRNKTRGAPRDGELLLHGIAWCARCGHKMYVGCYKNGGEYVCNHLRTHQGLPTCQHLARRRWMRPSPRPFWPRWHRAEIDALSRARRALHQADKAMRNGAERQLERKRYEAALAERQFNRCDPDNRLVAAELERRWEAALNEVTAAEEAIARQNAPQGIAQMMIGKELTDKVIRLSGRLPEIWLSPETTGAKRKALLRCLVEKVILDRGEHDVGLVRIVWRGGAVSELDARQLDSPSLKGKGNARACAGACSGQNARR